MTESGPNRILRRALRLAVFVCGIGLSGCQLFAPVQMAMPSRTIELTQTPFYAQEAFQCGPAALATVMSAAGVETGPDQLVDQVYIPGRKGSFQVEMLAAVRAQDRLPILLEKQPEALIAALDEGYPVLVLQNLRLRSWPAWHYAVLVGIGDDGFLLRSGIEKRKQASSRAFLRSWDWAGRWSVVIASPDQIPGFVSMEAWLRTAAALEQTGQLDSAHAAYDAATRRWPDRVEPWVARANAEYASGKLALAEQSLQQAVRVAPEHAIARNNLAQVLLELGCPQRARVQIQAIGDPAPALEAAFKHTLDGIDAVQGQSLECALDKPSLNLSTAVESPRPRVP